MMCKDHLCSSETLPSDTPSAFLFLSDQHAGYIAQTVFREPKYAQNYPQIIGNSRRVRRLDGCVLERSGG